MKFKTYTHSLPWTDKTEWQWPAGDKKLVQVFDHVSDIDVIMDYVKNRGVCVQAGGACGIWPLRFSQFFEQVYTFEPQEENFKCLVENTWDTQNITYFNNPLSNVHKKYVINNDIQERENWGAGYIVENPQGLEAFRIDDLELSDCDLIQLDIEGYELQALQGGAETIEKFRPIIVLEEKPLNHVSGNPAIPRMWLEVDFGYKLVGSVHRDVILSC